MRVSLSGNGIQDNDYPSNHTHAVGMHSVRWQVETQSDDWVEGESFRTRLGTKQILTVRVKAENKETWDQKNDICIDLYCSHDRWFSRMYDTLLETKCICGLATGTGEGVYAVRVVSIRSTFKLTKEMILC